MGATPDDRPKMTPHPWPDMVEPTTDEFLPWFLDQTPEAQAWLLERLREDASMGRDCWLMNHAERIERLSRDVPWVSRRSLPCRWRLHRLCKGCDCICWCHR